MKKVIVLLFLLFVLTSCSGIIFDHIEDINGEDNYSLAELTEDDILSSKSNLSLLSIFTTTPSGGNASIEKFSGVRNITEIKNKNKIIINFKLDNGNAALCICSKTKILYYFNINEENQEYVINTNEKLYLRLAGESAKVEIKYTFE